MLINVKGYLDYTYEVEAEASDAALDAKLAEDALRRFELVASAMTLPLSRRDVEVAVTSALASRGTTIGICVRLFPRIDAADDAKLQGLALMLLMLQKRVLLSRVFGPLGSEKTPPWVAENGEISFTFGEL